MPQREASNSISLNAYSARIMLIDIARRLDAYHFAAIYGFLLAEGSHLRNQTIVIDGICIYSSAGIRGEDEVAGIIRPPLLVNKVRRASTPVTGGCLLAAS